MAEKLAELPLVLPRTAAELNRAVELMSRKINEIIRTSRAYLDDVTELDSIPGNLDAAKLYGALNVDSVQATSAILGDTSITGFFDIPAGTSVNGFTWAGATSAPFSGLPVGSDLNLNFNADYLDGQHGAYYLDRANHIGSQDVATLNPGAVNTVVRSDGSTASWGQVGYGELTGVPATFAPAPHALNNTTTHTGTLAYNQFPSGGGTWNLGANTLTLTGNVTVGSLISPTLEETALLIRVNRAGVVSTQRVKIQADAFGAGKHGLYVS